jgi:hypothetical protein
MDDLAAKMTKLHVLKSPTRLTQSFKPWDEVDCVAYIASRSESVAALLRDGTPGVSVLCSVLVKHTGGRLREIQTLLPEVEVRLQKGRQTRHVVRTVLKWRTEAAASAVKRALEC